MALARRTTRRPVRAAAAVLGAAVLLALLTTAAPAGADEGAVPPSLADVLSGGVPGLDAVAVTDEDSMDMGIVVRFDNSGDDPIDVAIPFGTLVVTDDDGDQTMAVNPPDDPEVVEVAADGGTPTIEVPVGDSAETLPVYCTELGDSYPFSETQVTPIDPASAELATVLRAGLVEGVDHYELQSAVWWLTDEPTLPVVGTDATLLRDVDIEAFAAEPYRVIPDTGYTPMWMRDEVGVDEQPAADFDDEEAAAILDERFEGPASPARSVSDDGSGSGTLVWVVVIALTVVGIMALTTRAATRSRTHPAEIGHAAAGWYPDPWGHGRRYWNGWTWTDRTP